MEVIIEYENSNLVIVLIGELDESVANDVKNKIDTQLDNGIFDDIILDMRRLSFMDSTGIGVLIGRYKKVKNKHRIYVRNVSNMIDKIFNMAGLYQIIKKI